MNRSYFFSVFVSCIMCLFVAGLVTGCDGGAQISFGDKVTDGAGTSGNGQEEPDDTDGTNGGATNGGSNGNEECDPGIVTLRVADASAVDAYDEDLIFGFDEAIPEGDRALVEESLACVGDPNGQEIPKVTFELRWEDDKTLVAHHPFLVHSTDYVCTLKGLELSVCPDYSGAEIKFTTNQNPCAIRPERDSSYASFIFPWWKYAEEEEVLALNDLPPYDPALWILGGEQIAVGDPLYYSYQGIPEDFPPPPLYDPWNYADESNLYTILRESHNIFNLRDGAFGSLAKFSVFDASWQVFLYWSEFSDPAAPPSTVFSAVLGEIRRDIVNVYQYDFNNDGTPDLIFQVKTEDDPSDNYHFYVKYLGDELSENVNLFEESDVFLPANIFEGPEESGLLYPILTMGDFDDDGYNDLALLFQDDSEEVEEEDVGHLLIIFLSQDALDYIEANLDITPIEDLIPYLQYSSLELKNPSGLFVGDFNGDEIDDLLVKTYKAGVGDDEFSGKTLGIMGRKKVWPNTLSPLDVDIVISGLYKDDGFNTPFGATVAVEDINRDHFDDIIMAVPHLEQGYVGIFYGGEDIEMRLKEVDFSAADLLYTADYQMSEVPNPFDSPDGARFGMMVLPLCDLDNDGYMDFSAVSEDATSLGDNRFYMGFFPGGPMPDPGDPLLPPILGYDAAFSTLVVEPPDFNPCDVCAALQANAPICEGCDKQPPIIDIPGEILK